MVVKEKRFKRSYYIVLPLFILLFFFLQHTFQAAALGYLGLGLLFASVFLLDARQFYYAYALLIPNTFILKLLGNNAALSGYWLVLMTLRVIVTGYRNFPLRKSVLRHLVLHIACVCVSVFLTHHTSLGLSLIRFTCSIILLIYLKAHKTVDVHELIQKYILGNVLNVLLGAVYYVACGINLFSGFFAGIGNDRNYFAITLAFTVNLLAAYLYQNRKMTFSNILQLIVLFAGIFLSGSRTALLIVLPALITLFVFFTRRSRFTVRKFILLLLFVVGAILAFSLLEESIRQLLRRFTTDSVVGGNGRLASWSFYLKKVFSSWHTFLFGYGNSNNIVDAGYIATVEHNTFIQMLFSIGLFGSVSLLFLYRDIYHLISDKRGPKQLIQLFPLLSIVVGYFTINGLYSDNLTFGVILSVFLMNMPKGTLSGTPAATCPQQSVTV